MHRYGNMIMVVGGLLLLMIVSYLFAIHEIKSARESRENKIQDISELRISKEHIENVDEKAQGVR